MPIVEADQFTHSHHLLDDGTVVFGCSQDVEAWPWLALPPWHPIVVQTINFWAASGASVARRTLDPQQWSALTHIWWACGPEDAGHATHGVAEPDGTDGEPGYRLTFFDADGVLVYRMAGKGVVFQNRDFETLREASKDKITGAEPQEFAYADPAEVGAPSPGISFISRMIRDDPPAAAALVTEANGFPPGHPYLSGSGDHVNATHLAEIGRQFDSLLRGGDAPRCAGGEMRFLHFVELGGPMDVELVEKAADGTSISLLVRQADRDCATMSLKLDSLPAARSGHTEA